MAKITVKIAELGGDGNDYVQYSSIASFITIDEAEYLLESILLDNEDEDADLETIEGFTGMWETRAELDGTEFHVDETVTEAITDLKETLESLDDFAKKTKNWSPEQWEKYDADVKREQDEEDMPGGFN